MVMPWAGADPPNLVAQKWMPTIVVDENGHQWWDGEQYQPAELLGWWDGVAVQPVVLLGWWDGAAIVPVGDI